MVLRLESRNDEVVRLSFQRQLGDALAARIDDVCPIADDDAVASVLGLHMVGDRL